MSEKRFIFVDNIFKYLETGIKDNKSEYDSLNGESVVDLLNELVEENEQLRQQMEIENKWQLEKDRYYVQLQEENEQLRKENARFKRMLENLGYKVVMIDE